MKDNIFHKLALDSFASRCAYLMLQHVYQSNTINTFCKFLVDFVKCDVEKFKNEDTILPSRFILNCLHEHVCFDMANGESKYTKDDLDVIKKTSAELDLLITQIKEESTKKEFVDLTILSTNFTTQVFDDNWAYVG